MGSSFDRDVRVAVDIGGTFTDIVLATSNGMLYVSKVSTTGEDPSIAVLDGLVALLKRLEIEPARVSEIVHGTTVGSNTILQKIGAKTGLLTTAGFRDVLEIGRIRTPNMFDMTWEKPEPLAQRRHRLEVNERIAADGSVVRPLVKDEVAKIGEIFVAEGIEAVAISFINSYANPVHEQLAASILRKTFPSLHVCASCEILPEAKEYERTSTTVVNGYLLPRMQTYLEKLTVRLEALGVCGPLQIMSSNGGMMGALQVSHSPVFAVASGPAGGVTGAAALSRTFGYGDSIVFDMGGTTAKASIVEGGQPAFVTEYEFRDGISSPSRFIKGGGYMLKVPAIDIAEVGAGGGSIASIDAGGLLHVGPGSVGSDPGPACYDRGNSKVTVTDANVCLGYLNPKSLAGGSLKLREDLARQAVSDHLCGPLGLSVVDAAHGVRQVANVSMARAIRSVTVERGKDPRSMTMIAFGGGGPLHAVDVARILGIRRVIAPVMSGVFSAAGMLTADVEHSFVRSIVRRIVDCTPEWIGRHIAELETKGRDVLAKEGYRGSSVTCRFAMDTRYEGQSSELTIAFDADALSDNALADLSDKFQQEHKLTYGYNTSEKIEIANIRLAAVGVRGRRLDFETIRVDSSANDGAAGTRMVSFERGKSFTDVPLFPRSHIDGEIRQGPAIIESYDTTIVIPPASSFFGDRVGNIVIELDT
jgi:N-methylhydantoinase A